MDNAKMLRMPRDGERAVWGWMQHLRAVGRSENTIRQRRVYIRQALTVCDWATCTTGDLEAWLAGHPQWSAETRRAAVSALVGFFKWAHARGLRGDDPAAVLERPRQPDADPHPTPRAAYEAALASADDRTRLLLRLLATTGLRRSEAVVVHTDDVDDHGWLTVRGKGRRVRRVPLPPDVVAAVRGAGGFLFPGRVDGHAHPQWVTDTVKATTGYKAHSLRHLYATNVWRASGDLLAVQRLLGHANAATTERYVLMDADRIAAAAAAAWDAA
jgi:integrase/recombinase XerC